MILKPGLSPSFWFEPGDLTSDTLIFQKRESTTCCGFLGGDVIILATTGDDLLSVLNTFVPMIPKTDTPDHGGPQQDISERMDLLTSSFCPGTHPIKNSPDYAEKIQMINKMLWFSSGADIFRFSLEFWTDIYSFLKGTDYEIRFLKTLTWWLLCEADVYEKEKYSFDGETKSFILPERIPQLVQAINLYNHGAYELSSLL